MMRFEAADGGKASLWRRRTLIGAMAAGLGGALTGCGKSDLQTVSRTPAFDIKRLNADAAAIAARARPGVLGAAMINLESGENWSLDGARPFPMQSVFKLVLGAAALAEVEAGRLKLDEPIVLTDEMLSASFSPIAAAWPGRTTYTAGELLTAAVEVSDNTAADVLMKRIGGPGAVTGWLEAKNFHEIHVDRYEREIQVESVGLASFRAAWRSEPTFTQMMARVPPDQRLAAMRRYLADPRDTATPRAMTVFLKRLKAGELISPAYTSLLLKIMTASTTKPGRLRAALPKGATLAHKTGTGRSDQGISPVTNEVGIVTLADGRAYAMAVFLAGAALDAAGCDRIVADLGRAMLRGAG